MPRNLFGFTITAELIDVLSPLGEAIRNGANQHAFLTLLEGSKTAIYESLARCVEPSAAAKALALKIMTFASPAIISMRATPKYSQSLSAS